MLRGPQTPGELRQRVERLYSFRDGALETTLAGADRPRFVSRQARRPGQKEDRYAHRLSEDLEDERPRSPARRRVATHPPGRRRRAGSTASSARSRKLNAAGRGTRVGPDWE